MRSSAAQIALLLLSLIFLPSCSKLSKEKTITIYGKNIIDPDSTTYGGNFLGSSIEDLIYTSLVIEKSTGQYKNLLITRAAPIGDGRVWEIEIKEDVRFHNGAPLTVHDVIFSIEKRAEITPSLSAIKKATVIDGKRIRLVLDRPYRNIFNILKLIYVYPKGIFSMVEDWRETIHNNPVGSGPFRFSRWTKNGVELKANAEYFEGRPKIDRLVYIYENDEKKQLNSLLKEGADILVSISSEAARFLENDRKYSVNKLRSEYFVAVFLNNESAFFRDREVRRAVNLAVDREAIIEKALSGGGKAAYGPFTKEMLPKGYSPAPVKYDPKEAVNILREAGWTDKDGDGVLEKNGVKFKLVLYYTYDNDSQRLVADLISKQLYEVGIEVESKAVSFADFMERRFPDRYDAMMKDVSPFYPDMLWSERFYKDTNELNLSNYRNGAAESILDELKVAESLEVIMKKRSELDRLIRGDSPAIFLYNLIDYSAVNKLVKGSGEFYNSQYSYYMLRDLDLMD